MFMLMCLGFMRVSEFVNLIWDDIQCPPEGLAVAVKGWKMDQEAMSVRFLPPRWHDMFHGRLVFYPQGTNHMVKQRVLPTDDGALELALN